MGSTRGDEPPRRLVLFDGVCVFCDAAVRRLIAADPDASLRFAPLQGETAKALRARHPEIPRDLDTIVFVEAAGDEERIHLRSDAVFRIAALVPGPWRRLAWLRFLPGWLADLGYRLFARLRYRIFGRLDACPVPDPEVHARFLP
jgi:predicted DCC family thiol-disulfide oxidoreductase YuxK